MNTRWKAAGSVALLGALLVGGAAYAQMSVQHGRITNVRTVELQNQGANATGALVGGALGVASGSGQSRSNRALRGVGGAAVGSRLAGAAGSTTGFEYTVLIDRQTVRIVTEQAGMRVGDCVAIERGAHNNIRLVDDSRCDAAPGTRPPASATADASACEQAKEQLLNASTDAEFDRAERRMRLLCGD
jgi:outer membrane lipoprotein SlyB